MDTNPETFTIPGDGGTFRDMTVETEHPAIFAGFLALYGARCGGRANAAPTLAETRQWMREAANAAKFCGLCKYYEKPQ